MGLSQPPAGRPAIRHEIRQLSLLGGAPPLLACSVPPYHFPPVLTTEIAPATRATAKSGISTSAAGPSVDAEVYCARPFDGRHAQG